jgi:outer membrane protein assembly factor BamB
MRLSLPFLLLASALAFSQDNWPQFRGPTGDGHATGKNLVTSFSETENIRWKTPIHDKGWSSPVVWGDQVWLTTALANGKELFAIALDKNTGKIVHDLKMFTPVNPPDLTKFNSHASPTPAIEEGRVYLHYGSYGTACVDTKTGKTIWKREDLKCDHYRGPASSPVLWGDLLFLTFDGFDLQYSVALNKLTGETVWKKDHAIKYKIENGDYKKAFATPSILTVDGQPQLVTPAAEQTIAYDPKTGDELWRVTLGGMNEACKPVLAHGLIYLSTGHTSNLVAVKAGLKGNLDKSSFAWEFPKQAPTRPSVLVIGEELYLVNDTGIPACLDAKTGKKLWTARFDGQFSGSPVYAGGHIYFPGEVGKTYVIKPGKEYEEVAVNKLADGSRSSMAVSGDAIYHRTLSHLYCIGKK